MHVVKHDNDLPLHFHSLSVSIGFVTIISVRLLHTVSLSIVLLHLLQRALLHWTLRLFPLKHSTQVPSHLCV